MDKYANVFLYCSRGPAQIRHVENVARCFWAWVEGKRTGSLGVDTPAPSEGGGPRAEQEYVWSRRAADAPYSEQSDFDGSFGSKSVEASIRFRDSCFDKSGGSSCMNGNDSSNYPSHVAARMLVGAGHVQQRLGSNFGAWDLTNTGKRKGS